MPKCKKCGGALIVHRIRSMTNEKVYAHCSYCDRPHWLKVPLHIPNEQTMRYLDAKV